MSMPTRNKSSETKFYEPDNLNAIAGRVDSKSRAYAKKIHELGWIYGLYGALDGVSLSYSTVKYGFDVLLTNSKTSSSDAMHEWMMTPAGIAIASAETIATVTFSVLANIFDDKDPDSAAKRYIATIFPYVRDGLKSLKNADKGVKSALKVAHLLGGADLNYLMLPASLVLGSLAVVNRLLFRYMYTLRKDMMDANEKILFEIQNDETITAEKCRVWLAKMEENKQNLSTRILAMFSAVYAGSIDSLYLYVGVLSLCALTWPALVVMASFCAVYSLGCILSRVYEEYNFQRKLLVTHAKIELAVYSKEHASEMQACFTRLHKISKMLASGYKNADLLEEQYQLARAITEHIKIFSEKRLHLQSLLTLSHASAFMAGVINGLAAYRALASGMFALATVFYLSAIAFPPALLITCVSIGMALLIGFIAHSMINNVLHRASQEEDEQPYERLSHVLQVLKDVQLNPADEISEEEVRDVIYLGMEVKSSPKFYYEEWFEVARSFLSGPAKASKVSSYVLNPCQVPDDDGHYHDTPVITVLTVISSIVYSISLAIRALAKGFGRDDKKQVLPCADDAEATCQQDDATQENAFEQPSSCSMEAAFCGTDASQHGDCGETFFTDKSSFSHNSSMFFKDKASRSTKEKGSSFETPVFITPGPAIVAPDSGNKMPRTRSPGKLSFFSTTSGQRNGTCQEEELLAIRHSYDNGLHAVPLV